MRTYLKKWTMKKKKKLFNIENINTDYKPINQTITTKLIYKSMEDYFLFNKLIPITNYINFSILNIFALTIHEKKINCYEDAIIELFKRLKFSVRKYTEIILSIALRLYLKEKDRKYFKYFKFYKLCIEDMRQYPNEELNYLKEEIEKLEKQNDVNDDNEQVLVGDNLEKVKRISTIESFDKEKRFNFLQSLLPSKFKKKKNTQIKDMYYLKEIFDSTSKMLNDYYIDCDPKTIDKTEYKENVIKLLKYWQDNREEYPKDIDSFLFDYITLEE